MIKFHIDRHYEEEQTKGDLLINTGSKKFMCKTLELPWLDNQSNISCIPEGKYTVVVRYSNKYKRHLHIIDVEGRGYILIHWGNYAASKNPRSGSPDIRGCVLVGQSYADFDGDGHDEITASKKQTFNKIMDLIEDDDAKIELEICGNGGEYGPE